jgi:hypothetical protein
VDVTDEGVGDELFEGGLNLPEPVEDLDEKGEGEESSFKSERSNTGQLST